MGLFNTLKAKTVCPACGKPGTFDVQFKYGHVRQLSYSLGDVLVWGGNDQGKPMVRLARVEAISGECAKCYRSYLEFDIYISYDRIVDLRPVGVERTNPIPVGYEVLEE